MLLDDEGERWQGGERERRRAAAAPDNPDERERTEQPEEEGRECEVAVPLARAPTRGGRPASGRPGTPPP